jgi:hypothetical protein
MRQNGLGTLTLEDARTWIEETGLCLFLPRRQFSSSIAPSFVEAVGGRQDATPDAKTIALAEELLVRLELDGVAVRLNLLGQPGEQPDFVVAAWVLPYVYALRGDRDWRRNPQLTGSRQVSQLAVLTYKQLEAGDATISQLRQALGREVSESAVLRAITELWQQLRIIPVIAAPGQAAKWQLLRTRFQRAIAEGASTSQVTAISVLASIYLQAVIAASMEDVELFLAPLTARSKIREVLRGLVATRQVHTISMGHAPHFYVAGTLPEFETVATMYASSSMAASAYFLRSFERDEEQSSRAIQAPPAKTPVPVEQRAANNGLATGNGHAGFAANNGHTASNGHAADTVRPTVNGRVKDKGRTVRTPVRRPAAAGKQEVSRTHFGRATSRSRDRKAVPSGKQGQPESNGRSSSRRGSVTRSASSRGQSSVRPSTGTQWGASKGTNGNGKHNGTHSTTRSTATRPPTRARSNGNGVSQTNGSGASRTVKPSAKPWTKRPVHANGAKPAHKSASTSRVGSLARKDSRTGRTSRQSTLAAGVRAGSGKRLGFAARAKQGTKKRG